MSTTLTITVSDDVYRGLRDAAGNRTIGEVIEDLARLLLVPPDLDAAYREMGLDAEREAAAFEWADGLHQDSVPGGLDAAR